MTAFPTIESVRAEASPTFPCDLVREARDAACFFGAAFLGRNAEVFLATDLAIPRAWIVDSDATALDAMRRVYADLCPRWTFVRGDAYEVAEAMDRDDVAFDLVTVDPWSQDIARALGALSLWCAVARRWVVIGARRADPVPDLPHGWRLAARVERSDHRGGIDWLVLASGRE